MFQLVPLYSLDSLDSIGFWKTPQLIDDFPMFWIDVPIIFPNVSYIASHIFPWLDGPMLK